MTLGGTAIAADANTPALVGTDRLWRLALIGAAAGVIASMLGVGGGIVMVPLLMALLAYPVHQAAATSLAAIIVTASVGALTHGALDNVRLLEAILIGVPAMAGVTLGVSLAKRLSSRWLRLGFAGLMVVIAIQLVVG